MKSTSKLLSVIFVCFLGGLAYLYYSWTTFLTTPIIPANQTMLYRFKPGSSVNSLANDLAKTTNLKHPLYLRILARLTNSSRNLQAGLYRFTAGTTPEALLDQLTQGDVVTYHLTVVEGWTFQKLLKVVEANPHLVHHLSGKSFAAIVAAIGIKRKNPEGLFYPTTYQFPADTTDIQFLQRAHQSMQKILQEAWINRAPNLPYQNVYAALIAASLIEKETAKPSERGIIAGIIVKRLRHGIPLQMDPSVIYALGEHYDGKLTRRDMRVKSPYNTYRYRGLPPTPIALVGLASLHAALNPVKTPYLYFVAKGDGSHVFSATLAEQRAAIKTYILNKKITIQPKTTDIIEFDLASTCISSKLLLMQLFVRSPKRICQYKGDALQKIRLTFHEKKFFYYS